MNWTSLNSSCQLSFPSAHWTHRTRSEKSLVATVSATPHLHFSSHCTKTSTGSVWCPISFSLSGCYDKTEVCGPFPTRKHDALPSSQRHLYTGFPLRRIGVVG